jgi:hypothetical protein
MLLKRKKRKIINLFCQRKIKIVKTSNVSFNLIEIKKRLVFLIKTADSFLKHKYIILPTLFKISIKNNIISFLFLNKKKFHNLYYMFIHFINKTQIFYKQLILRGSGFKVVFFSKLNQLECKLGFTHKKYVVVPAINHLDVIFRKPVLVALDYNTSRLGNFIRTIKNTKKANAYSGRGFWDLKEQQNLKVVKKQ